MNAYNFSTITKPDAILYTDDSKPIATDDVFYGKYFKWKIYPFAEAVECHRENFHPTMYDLPNALLKIFVELNMMVAFHFTKVSYLL